MTLIDGSATTADQIKAQIESIEQNPAMTDVWKFRTLMAGVEANAEYARAFILHEVPEKTGYLGPYELAMGLRPAQYAHHASVIADHALYWAAKIAEDNKES